MTQTLALQKPGAAVFDEDCFFVVVGRNVDTLDLSDEATRSYLFLNIS